MKNIVLSTQFISVEQLFLAYYAYCHIDVNRLFLIVDLLTD